jgi:hypothetical protein
MGDLVNRRFRFNRSCVVKSLNNTPLFGEVVCCLAGIPGESRDSGHGSGLDAVAKSAVLSPCQERFLGQCSEGHPDSRTGLIMGDLELELVIFLNHSCDAGLGR